MDSAEVSLVVVIVAFQGKPRQTASTLSRGDYAAQIFCELLLAGMIRRRRTRVRVIIAPRRFPRARTHLVMHVVLKDRDIYDLNFIPSEIHASFQNAFAETGDLFVASKLCVDAMKIFSPCMRD